jgi:NAD(P)-dependent dehydrogenase (short-subunit alcohol dehydrogenase family)
MARVFITGSSDGLGLMAARLLIEQGHDVVLHGRNDRRSRDALAAAAGAWGVVTGDLSTIAGAKTVAHETNKLTTAGACGLVKSSSITIGRS